LDDVTAPTLAWCEQARRLCEAHESSGPESLPDRLDAIAAGLVFRRQLDLGAPDEPVESTRRDVLRWLSELQALTDAEMELHVPDKERHDLLVRRSRDWLDQVRSALRSVSSTASVGLLQQALAIEGLRNELEWHAALIHRLDGETPHPASAWIDVELARLIKGLGFTDARDSGVPHVSLQERSDRLQAIMLDRRIRRELAHSSESSTPEALWSHRFQLTRLQAQAKTLDVPAGLPRQGDLPPHNRNRWIDELDRRRTELAQTAEQRLRALPEPARIAACERIVQASLDETGETTAFLEDMSKRRAVDRLDLLGHDLTLLADSALGWPQLEARLNTTPEFPDLSSLDSKDAGPGPTAGDADAAELAEQDQVSASAQQARQDAARKRLRKQHQVLRRASRQVERQWQEKLLALRLEKLFGRRFVALLENTVLILIFVLFLLIVGEALLERTRPDGLSVWQHWFFACADLAVCSVFLFEFTLKFALAPHRWTYFLRHALIDLLASLPFGFVAHLIELDRMNDLLGQAGGSRSFWHPAQIARVARAFRFLRVALPIVRLARLGLILLRLSDRLVNRMGRLLNRNIVLFEPLHAQKPESSDRHRLVALRSEVENSRSTAFARLDRHQAGQLWERTLSDLECGVERLPAPTLEFAAPEIPSREIPVEAVVERLIQMTPERLLDQIGPAQVKALDRYLRLLDLPLLRRLRVVRNLVAYREKSSAEAVALAANYLGHLIQRALDVVYFFADLHGTLSPPVFLDRLGSTIVNATRTPAKRLLWLGAAFLFLFVIVNSLPFPATFQRVVDKVQTLMGLPVIILGIVCLVFWLLGAWFRKIANQSADYCERVVEAQFATHTKGLKSRRRDQDAEFLSQRVINPELLLRSSDDRQPPSVAPSRDEEARHSDASWFENRELAFLRNVRLLYQDYLDGSPLHRSDTKASVQLLGNLALSNLRRSHLGHLLREGRTIDRLDLSRSGGLFGGPYLWFNYITRMLVQETAILLLDYNRHAIPLDRLACSPPATRRRFRAWLSDRLKIDPSEVWVPELSTPTPAAESGTFSRTGMVGRQQVHALRTEGSTRREAGAFLETVEFTAVDFLADDPERDSEIHARFGPQVAELVRRDRQQNVRRAFRSFPLHELPLAARTINVFSFYEAHLAGGRITLFPFLLVRSLARAIVVAFQSIFRVVNEILHPQVDRQQVVGADTYWAALRKIHRMRKPVFMGSLWLRARFDVEYMGLPLPSAPAILAGELLMEADLDYIGATRRDRIIAEEFRRQHQNRLEWIARWLDRFGWTFDLLPSYLSEHFPYLANRGGEALRALVAACILDHDDIATLALSIEGLKSVMEFAADGRQGLKKLPPGLPGPVVSLRTLWHPVNRIKRPRTELFELPCFPSYDQASRKRILTYLRRHRRLTRGWVKVVLGQGKLDPWSVVKSRMRDVLLRTDLWSDQILVLRAVQTLTMLDLQHNCELVWNLGGYTHPEQGGIEPNGAPPRSAAPSQDEEPVSSSMTGV
jgi:hypothetical protein